MFLLASVVPCIVLASTVVAGPIVVRDSRVSLPFKKHVATSTSIGRRLVHGRQDYTGGHNAFLTNAMTYYQVIVGIGMPPANYTLVVDTGSANTWVGAGKPYVKTETSHNTTNSMNITYGTGAVNGTEYTDTVTLAPNLVISDQGIGVAQNTRGISGFDGILGMGPTNLTIRTLHPDVNESIPTVTDNLYKNGTIPYNIFSVSFEPTNQSYFENGEITFGGTDPTKYIRPLTYAPISTTFPANHYWSVNASIRYDESEDILNNTSCLVDSGTTDILLSAEAYKRYVNATGATFDNTTDFLRISLDQYTNLTSLFVKIADKEFELTRNAQIFPRALNGMIGGTSVYTYIMIRDISSATNSTGLPQCILGIPFLERFYTVFDAPNRQIGFASTPFTNSEIN